MFIKSMAMESSNYTDFKLDAFAGAVTGIVELTLMYPMDVIKTRMQGIKPHTTPAYSSVMKSFKTITKNEGLQRLYRGMPMPYVTILPANAVYWVTYEYLSRALSLRDNPMEDFLAQGASGSMATIARTLFTNPADVVKQRMQMYSSPYKSNSQCLKAIFKSEGIAAFYRSFSSQIAIDIPFGAIYFVVYVACQGTSNETEHHFQATKHIVSGAAAGGLAAAITNPIDVCRTLVNTQEASTLGVLDKAKVKGLLPALFVVYKFHGLKGFKKGIAARVVYHVPSAGFGLLTYAFMKHTFSKKQANQVQEFREW